MYPPLPREVYPFFGQSGAYHRQRVYSLRTVFRGVPAERERNFQRNRKVKVLLSSGEKVIASLAPSFIANYEGAGIGGMRTALKKLGFYDAEETAIGATIVKTEYENMLAEKRGT